MLPVTDDNFQIKVLDSKLPVLVDFYADWCGPCQLASPILEELAKEYEGKLVVGEINVEKSPQTPQKYGIMSIPTIAVFKNGEEVKRLVGFPGKPGYLEFIKSVIE